MALDAFERAGFCGFLDRMASVYQTLPRAERTKRCFHVLLPCFVDECARLMKNQKVTVGTEKKSADTKSWMWLASRDQKSSWNLEMSTSSESSNVWAMNV